VVSKVKECVTGWDRLGTQLIRYNTEHNAKHNMNYMQGWAQCPTGAASSSHVEVYGRTSFWPY